MDKTLGISVVLGAALGKGYFKTFESVKQKTARLGREWAKTNKKLATTGAVIKYKNLLDQLRAKQVTLGTSSKRLQDGINQVERRYKAAKRAAKGYGIQMGQVTAEHGRLQAALRRTQQQTIAHTRAQNAASSLGAMRGRMLGLLGTAYGASRLTSAAMSREEQGLYLRTVINAQGSIPAHAGKPGGSGRGRAGCGRARFQGQRRLQLCMWCHIKRLFQVAGCSGSGHHHQWLLGMGMGRPRSSSTRWASSVLIFLRW